MSDANPFEKHNDREIVEPPDWEAYPTCPHCGNIDYDWWENQSLKYDGDESETECCSCCKPIKITMIIETSFLTVKNERKENG